jgi:hypothetical protein
MKSLATMVNSMRDEKAEQPRSLLVSRRRTAATRTHSFCHPHILYPVGSNPLLSGRKIHLAGLYRPSQEIFHRVLSFEKTLSKRNAVGAALRENIIKGIGPSYVDPNNILIV